MPSSFCRHHPTSIIVANLVLCADIMPVLSCPVLYMYWFWTFRPRCISSFFYAGVLYVAKGVPKIVLVTLEIVSAAVLSRRAPYFLLPFFFSSSFFFWKGRFPFARPNLTNHFKPLRQEDDKNGIGIGISFF